MNLDEYQNFVNIVYMIGMVKHITSDESKLSKKNKIFKFIGDKLCRIISKIV